LFNLAELKPIDPGDAEIIFQAWGRYPENFSFLTARVFEDLHDAQLYLARLFTNPDSKAFHIVDPGAGVIGIAKATILQNRAQIGYVVHRPFWGRGFATAAVRQLTEIIEGMPAISRIWATCALGNPASARVLEKCGFQREAILKNWVTYPAQGDRSLDNYSYVKIPGQWSQRAPAMKKEE
jgi:ribosomal-protein-alanine N-acetyltransferase